MPPLTPSVLTSNAAQNHIDTVVKPAVQEANTAIANQAQKTPAPSNVQTPTTSATMKAPSTSVNAPQNTYSYIATDGTSKTIQAANPQEAMSKAPDIAAHSGVQATATPAAQQSETTQTTTQPDTTQTTNSTTTSTPEGTLSDAQKQMDQAQADYQAQAKQVSDSILGITNGTIPLSLGEEAQISALRGQFEQLIQQQTETNKNSISVANIRGYQTGSAEYDPMFQVKTIGSIVSAGQRKIADLQLQEAGALADLTTKLKANDISGIKDAWNVYQDAQTKRQDTIQKTIDAATKAISDAQTAQQKQIDAVNTIATNAAKNGAPASVLAAITASGTEAGALTAAADYLQTATGAQGDYLLYVRQAKAAGQIPVDYNTYLTMNANRKVKSGGTGSTGSTNDTETIAQAIIDGHQPPVTTGLYGKTAAVRAALERNGYNLTKANQDWTATQKLLATLNGAQQVRLRQAVNQVSDSLDLTQSLADQWDGSGLPTLNAATLASAKAGLLGPEAQSLATRLDAQIADVTSELGTVYKGGNSSTDESLKLAAQNLQSNWSRKTFDDAIAQAKQNIQIRKNSLSLTTAGVTDSNYNPTNAALLQQGAQDPLHIAPAGTDTTTNPLGL